MANYEAPLLLATVSTTFKTTGALWSVGTGRAMVYEVEFGQTGALASTDCQCEWDLSVFSSTNIGTFGASPAPNKLDPADGASTCVFGQNATTELTYTTAGNGLALK